MRKGVPGGLGNIRVPSEQGMEVLPADRARQRRIWELDVRRGKLTPARAEELAEQAGQPAFVTVKEQDRLDVQATYWPLALALFSVAWADVDQVARVWAEYKFWKEQFWRNPTRPGQKMSLLAAKHRTNERLVQSTLKVSGVYRGYRQDIDGAFWIDAKWEFKGDQISILSRNGNRCSGILLHSPLMAEETVRDESSKENIGIEPKAKLIRPKGLGGRPQVHDWDAMWIEVCRRIHEDGVPETASKFRDSMKLWFVERGLEEPGATEMKRKFSALYRALKREPG